MDKTYIVYALCRGCSARWRREFPTLQGQRISYGIAKKRFLAVLGRVPGCVCNDNSETQVCTTVRPHSISIQPH